MKQNRKYWVEISLIIGYLISDNLHMIIENVGYVPKWYQSPYPNYHFYDSIFYTFHYFSQAPLLMTTILLLTSPKDVNKIWLRSALFLASLRDFTGELLELLNINLKFFSNEGYNASCWFKIGFLISCLLITLKFKKQCMKLVNYLSSV